MDGDPPVAPGFLTPIEINLTGANTRTVFTSAITADGTATFTGLGQTQLVDTNNDGKVDELDVGVNVNTTVAGHYQLAVDTYTPAGKNCSRLRLWVISESVPDNSSFASPSRPCSSIRSTVHSPFAMPFSRAA